MLYINCYLFNGIELFSEQHSSVAPNRLLTWPSLNLYRYRSLERQDLVEFCVCWLHCCLQEEAHTGKQSQYIDTLENFFNRCMQSLLPNVGSIYQEVGRSYHRPSLENTHVYVEDVSVCKDQIEPFQDFVRLGRYPLTKFHNCHVHLSSAGRGKAFALSNVSWI